MLFDIEQVKKRISIIDKDELKKYNLLFGGGTLISLLIDNFRMSSDIDFFAPTESLFRQLKIKFQDEKKHFKNVW